MSIKHKVVTIGISLVIIFLSLRFGGGRMWIGERLCLMPRVCFYLGTPLNFGPERSKGD
ncbi:MULTISPECIES: hypothetical protein [unclassified Synechocystis]|uniref:hypothetical protein n=1 Tax=unclassified Synechocystis TaxID=2640012 RepID=UPI00040AD621|nr:MULTISPECIES: hypothetical protein [unclassified Synechocystis]AIE73836.1 hypothetical protein D082_13080 [Synechocystis sp. PCC 6714]MCT0252348.1 hypothetical protein [Synechocystis sp. CS-94]